MTITIIAAVAKNGVIGANGAIPWSLPEDMHRFRELTVGNTVIMGNNTKNSLNNTILPNRRNVVVSTRNFVNRAYNRDSRNFNYYTSIEDAIANNILSDIYIIGGSQIYSIAEQYANRMELTLVDLEPEGDTFFPELKYKWNEISRENHVSKTGIRFSYVTLERDKIDTGHKA